MIVELRSADELEGEGGSLALLTFLALVVGAISGAGDRPASCCCSNRRINCATPLSVFDACARDPRASGSWSRLARAAAGIAAFARSSHLAARIGSGIPHVEAVLKGQAAAGAVPPDSR